MPGYGFAARSGDELRRWREMIETFLAARGNLVGLLLVMDVRRDWSDDEANLLEWMKPRRLPTAVILTKADKLSRSAGLNRVREIKKQSGLENVMLASALKKTGVVEIENFVFENWVKPEMERRKVGGS